MSGVDDTILPQPKTPDPQAPPRVMTMDQIDDHDKARVAALVESSRTTTTEKVAHDYYCGEPNALRDFQVSAQRAADVTLRAQLIHMHLHGTSCEDMAHHVILPDSARTEAVGGPTH